MSTVTIFGKGNMGQAIAGVLARGGADIQHIGQGSTAQIEGDIVILAVPYGALAQIAADFGDQLDGRTVVDITNPLDFETFDRLVVPVGSSAAAEFASAVPGARVLKAFNTTFAATLASGKVGGQALTTVLIAGDDAASKTQLSELITTAGLGAIDAGSLSRAHELEALGFLQLTLAASEKITWTGGFGVIS
ncbi:MAG: NADPH-dependent F420 reductase [Microbacterium sp.]|jgi:predicted dinucleotide-binding enzyme|nr:NADPH-dependent F420 reductase [Microbacterium sp.]